MIRIFGTALAGLLGLAFGSLLNVCLSRWPEGESVVHPRSHCRNCGRTLAWWENIPLLSWLALRGRCRTCNARISWRYPLVELTVGVLWATVTWQSLGPTLEGVSLVSYPLESLASILCKLALMWMVVALAALDAQHLWLPNWLTVSGIALGLLNALVQFVLARHFFILGHGPLYAAAVLFGSIVAAAGLILLIRWIYWLIRRREGIGLGDAKLMAMLAAWLGLPGALLSFAIGVFLGAAVALMVLLTPKAKRNQESVAMTKLPLGTFLCIGGIVSALWGQPILTAYVHWAGF